MWSKRSRSRREGSAPLTTAPCRRLGKGGCAQCEVRRAASCGYTCALNDTPTSARVEAAELLVILILLFCIFQVFHICIQQNEMSILRKIRIS